MEDVGWIGVRLMGFWIEFLLGFMIECGRFWSVCLMGLLLLGSICFSN